MFISIAVAVVVVWILGSHFRIKKVYRIVFSAFIACLMTLPWYLPAKKAEEEEIAKYNERKAKYEEAKAVFDEQCKKAGEKIYRTVDNVDGVMLLKVRDEEEHEIGKSIFVLKADPMWSHAAIANREVGDYIHSFLISGGKKQYSFVDVLEKDGSVSRYLDGQRRDKDVPIKNPSNSARYAVTYENNVDPELRKHWVAGITIKIIDRQTDELLAEKTIFSFEPGLGSKATGRDPWGNAKHCPELLRWEEQNPTRNFTFQVLKLSQPLNSQE